MVQCLLHHGAIPGNDDIPRDVLILHVACLKIPVSLDIVRNIVMVGDSCPPVPLALKCGMRSRFLAFLCTLHSEGP